MKRVLVFFIIAIATITATTVYAYSEGLVKESKKEVFNISFENINNTKGNGNVILEKGTDLDFDCDLKIPGDTFEFTVDMVNNSDKDAIVDETAITKLNEEQEKYLKYTVTYENGKEIQKGDILNHNEKKTLKVRVEFKYDITEEDLPKEEQNIDLMFNVTMIEK